MRYRDPGLGDCDYAICRLPMIRLTDQCRDGWNPWAIMNATCDSDLRRVISAIGSKMRSTARINRRSPIVGLYNLRLR